MTKTATKITKLLYIKLTTDPKYEKNKFQAKDINEYKSKYFYFWSLSDILKFGDEKCLV